MEMKSICWLNAAQFRSYHVLDQLKESSRVCAAAVNQRKRPTKRNNSEKRCQATALSGGPGGVSRTKETVKALSKCVIFLSNSPPLTSRFPVVGCALCCCLLFPHAVVQAHHEICGLRGHATAVPHSPTQQHKPLSLVLPCDSRHLSPIIIPALLGGLE